MAKSRKGKSKAYQEGWRSMFNLIEGSVRQIESMLASTRKEMSPEDIQHWCGERDAGIEACKTLSNQIRAWAEEEQ